MTWTAEQDAALLAKWRRENAEFAAWSAGVQSGQIRLHGVERDAQRAGYRAGLAGWPSRARTAATEAYSARELVAWAVGYGEGRAVRHGQR